MRIKHGEIRELTDFIIKDCVEAIVDRDTLKKFEVISKKVFDEVHEGSLRYELRSRYDVIEVYFLEELEYKDKYYKYAYFLKNGNLVFATEQAEIEFGEYDDGIIIIEKKDFDLLHLPLSYTCE